MYVFILSRMSNERFGDIARKLYTRWNHRQLSVLEHQEKIMLRELSTTKSYIMNEILEDAISGAKFRRFFYNELNTSHTFNKPIYNYEVSLIFKDEKFDLVYEKDSFIVTWCNELK
jgi:hypothetical protein